MSLLVAVDPSIRSAGLALFHHGALVLAESLKTADPPPGATLTSPASRALYMARRLTERVWEWNRGWHPSWEGPIAVATEWPQIYRAQRAAGDPNDLPGIAAVGTALAAQLNAAMIVSYTPRDWAGQVPKATRGDCKESPRARRIRSRLASPAEIAVWEALRRSDHDAIDAIGIGLHHLGRGLV